MTVKATSSNTKNIYARFAQKTAATLTFESATNGSYTVTDGTNTVTAPGTLTTEETVTLTATPASGYKVYRWYTKSGSTKTYFSMFSKTVSQTFTSSTTVGVEFIPADTPVFQIKGSTSEYYTDLNDAIAAVGNTSSVIVLIENGTLPAGNYTIAAKTTLLIPYDAAYTVLTTSPIRVSTYSKISVYKTLKLAEGANITVNGAISIGGQIRNDGQFISSSTGSPGSVLGSYGCIDMSGGGYIQLNSGAKLYAWGFVIGQNNTQGNNTTGVGAIKALSGSAVYEDFVLANFRGGTATSSIISSSNKSKKVFPINQYFIPNIEVPLTLETGATEMIFTSVSVTGSSDNTVSVPFIGNSNGSFFKLGSNGMLKKWYDATTDYMVVELDGTTELNSISLNIAIYSVTSSDYVLPITNNLDIRVKGGTLNLPYDLCILPGARITIDKGATANVKANLYVYDLDEWGYYVSGNSQYYLSYEFRPTTHHKRTTWTTKAELADAQLMVNGQLNVSGKMYCTASGANICSTGGGQITFSTAPTATTTTYQYENNSSFASISCVAPWLKNADESYVQTAGTAANTTYYYYRGAWTTTIPTTMPGDVNGDGVFDQADIDAVALAIVGRRGEVENFDEEVADVDNDGYITIIDLTQLVNQLKGR